MAAGCDDPKPNFGDPPSRPPDLTSAVVRDMATPVLDASDPAPAAPAAPKASLFVRSSRCGECHEKFRIEWSDSPHARASRTTAYRKVFESATAAQRTLCQRCHLPSFAYGQPDEEPSRPSEGVSCDGCHTLSQVQVQGGQATMKFDPASGSKYGPIVGASGHYFHDMAYSALHTKSEFCAGCHHATEFVVGTEKRAIPIVTDYSDWQKYGKGKACQDCHMPSRGSEPVARGSKPRPNVPSHAFPGAVGLGKLIRLEVAGSAKPGEIGVELAHTAGHMLPSGYVDRRLILRVEWFAATGTKLASEDRSFGIKLVDAAGKPAPFYLAVRVQEDHRLIPGKTYTESFVIPTAATVPAVATAPVARVTLSLLAAPTAPELSAVYGEPTLALIKSTSHPVPMRPGGK